MKKRLLLAAALAALSAPAHARDENYAWSETWECKNFKIGDRPSASFEASRAFPE